MVEYLDFTLKSGLGNWVHEGKTHHFEMIPNVMLTDEQMKELTKVGKVYGLFLTEDDEMPKPTNEQIVDAVKDEHKKNAHLGIEFAIQSVMDQYDISGVDVAVAFVTAPAMKVAATDDVVEAEETKKKK